MNKRAVVLIIVAVVLGGWCVYAYSGLFASTPIRIIYQLEPQRKPDSKITVYPVAFGLNRDVTITSILVLPTDADPDDPAALPMWHLVYSQEAHDEAMAKARQKQLEDPSARPPDMTARSFVYGRGVRGLKRADKAAKIKPLQPGVTYRLYLEAQEGDAQIDFQTKALPKP